MPFVNPSDLSQSLVADGGLKRVTVALYRGTQPIVTLSAIRSVSRSDPKKLPFEIKGMQVVGP